MIRHHPDEALLLAYAGGAPLRALEYAANAEVLERLLQHPMPVDDRDAIEALADALQKIALDRALGAMGLPPKYQTGTTERDSAKAREWLSFARGAGEGKPFRLEGEVVLRRVNDVDGATADQLRWHIAQADLKSVSVR